MIVVSICKSGCNAWNRAIIASMVARGAGFEVSRKITRSPLSPADAGADRMVAAASAAVLSMERMGILHS